MALQGERKRSYQQKWIANRRETYIQAFGGKCVRCNSTDRLEFDHINRETKFFRIGNIWSRSKDVIEAELAKCQLLCYLCHKEKTKNEFTKIEHGTRNTYMKHGCRCKLCVMVASEYRTNQRKRTRPVS